MSLSARANVSIPPSPLLASSLAELPELQELLAQLRPFAQEKPFKSWSLTCVTLVLVAGAFALALSPLPLAWRLAGSCGAGLLMVRLFTIYHDYMHGAILRESKFAYALMYLVGSFLLRPMGDWKRSHNFHHQQNSQFESSSVGSFPLMTIDDWKAASPGRRLYYRLARSPLIIVTGYLTCFLLQTFRRALEPDRVLRFHACVALALHALLVGLAIAAGWQAYLLAILIPFGVACASGAYLFYIQHNFEGVLFLPTQAWEFEFASLKSSSCLKTNPIAHWLTGNIGYHHIHHLNPKIPFYRLPEAMRQVPGLQSPTFVNLSPRSIYRGFRLKLWCPLEERMLPFPRG
jgi:omega-6 fatty acid desaturase (delta-12 desaturase)